MESKGQLKSEEINGSATTPIVCKNVVKINFAPKPTSDSPSVSKDSNKKKITQPILHPSLSHDSLFNNFSDPSVSSRRVEGKNQKQTRPPPQKQRESIDLLLKQHNESNIASSNYLFLISAAWMRKWYTLTHITTAEDPPQVNEINNWNLIIETEHQNTSATTIDYENNKFNLRKGLEEHVDFFFVPREAWNALYSWYGGGPPLPRFLFNSLRFRTQVPCDLHNLLKFNTFPLGSNSSRESLSGTGNDSPEVHFSPDGTAPLLHQQDLYPPAGPPSVRDVLDSEREAQQLSWKNSPGKGLSGFASVDSLHTLGGNPRSPLGGKLRSEGIPEAPAEEEKESPLVKRSVGVRVPLSHCHVCERPAVNRCSKCSCIYYCGRDCQMIHWRFHKLRCKKLEKLGVDKSNGQNQGTIVHDRMGRVGLLNLGNSCYMNSSLQCFSHIKPLVLGLLSKRFFKDLNTTNIDGTGGHLVEQLTLLLQDLWFLPKKPDTGLRGNAVSAVKLKSLLGRINPEYAGLQQQDAHEFIEFLLDKLHEDLNRVKTKPYTLKVEGDGTDDETAAAETWTRHGLRDSSVVKDLMGSLMRSQLTCPDCGKVSVSFEYHHTIQLAIPRDNTREINVIFVPELSSLFSSEEEKAWLSVKGGNEAVSMLRTAKAREKLAAAAPIKLKITLDRLNNIGSLETQLKKQIPSSFLSKSEGSLLLLQASSEIGKGKHRTVTRFLLRSQPLSILPEADAAGVPLAVHVFAYCPSPECPNQIILLQRSLLPILPQLGPSKSEISIGAMRNARKEGRTSNKGGMKELQKAQNLLESHLAMGLTGIPILLSYDNKWSCNRIRFLVWINAFRFMDLPPMNSDKFSENLRPIKEMFDLLSGGSSTLALQMRVSEQLSIRLVDPLGEALLSPFPSTPPGSSSSSGSGLEHGGGLLRSVFVGGAGLNNDQKKEWLQTLRELAQDAGDDESLTAANEVDRLWELCGALDLDGALGSSLPIDRNLKFEEFAGAQGKGKSNNIVFLSLDFHGPWLCAYANEKIDSMVEPDVSDQKISPVLKNGKKKNAGLSLEKCLQEHTREEILDADNEWYCGVCKEHKRAKKNVKFCKDYLPDVLVLSLKRFEYRSLDGMNSGWTGRMAHREKIDSFVDFPIDNLDLSPFFHQNPNGDKELYDLFAVCNHYGRMGFGHYTAFVREWESPFPKLAKFQSEAAQNILGEQWFCYDDQNVVSCGTGLKAENEVKSSSAYILFYRKRLSKNDVDF